MKTVNMIAGVLLVSVAVTQAEKRPELWYDAPAINQSAGRGKAAKTLGFMQTALPLGNGRLGAMFSGGIDREHLLMNEITLWMNAKRGLDEVSQSGTRKGAAEDLETVREVYRAGHYGSKGDSMENVSTKYLSSTEPLGNYAPFTDVMISTGHDPKEVKNYRRTLDPRLGLGSVSYQIGDGRFTREYFCSFPDDLLVAHYTAENATINLTIHTTSKHKGTVVQTEENRIILTGASTMVKDDMEFMQLIQVDAGGAKVRPQADGSIHISDVTEVTVYLTGYTDYLPIYPAFKGRDFKADCEKTIASAVARGREALKNAHVTDFSTLMDRCHLDLNFQTSGLTTDKLVAGGGSLELEELYFNYSRYLQLSCSRGAPVPSNL